MIMDGIKGLVLEILDFYRYKILSDKCTPEDLETIFDALDKNIISEASIKDIAEYYGQSESNVRNIASRKIIDKPKRRVFYNFAKFVQIVPVGWIKGRKKH